MGCNRRCCYGPRAAIVAAVIGTLLCIGFSVTFHYSTPIIQNIVIKFLPLTPDGPMYEPFVDISLDPNICVYFFNYTNVDEFLANWTQGVKPKVEQKGPYVYTVHYTKVFLDWSEPPYLSYRQLHYYHFHPELSCENCQETDPIVMPNPMAMLPVGMVKSSPMAKLLDYIMTRYPDAEPPFVTVSVVDFLFYGYYDEAVYNAQEAIGVDLFPGALIGFLYGKNGSDDRKYKMDTGVDDVNEMYHIVEWDGHESMDYVWNDTYCGMINGSDGTMFPPHLTPYDTLYVYISFLRRSLFLNFTNEVKYKGINSYNYQIPLQLYADYNMYPDNTCYTNGDPELAYASGSLYAGEEILGGKAYLSNPHFMGGDFKLVEAIDGLHPMGNEHATQLVVIPEFGAPIAAKIRVQLNLLMQPGKGMNHTSDWPTVMLPVAWVNGSLELTDDMADDVIKYYYGGMKWVSAILAVLLTISGLVALAGIFCAYKLMFQFKSDLLRQPKEHDHFKEEGIDIEENDDDKKFD